MPPVSAQLERILEAAPISSIYRALTGVEPRRTGRATWRASRPGGDSRDRISGDDSRGVFHDFVDGSGGGVIDLVVGLQGGSRQDALRWVANFAGIALEDAPLTTEDRARFAEQRQADQRDLPNARLFRRAAAMLCEEALVDVKARYFDPMNAEPDYLDAVAMRDITRLLESLNNLGDGGMLVQYREWMADYPGMTTAMVRAMRAREQVEHRALLAYLRQTNPQRRPAAA